MGSISGCVVYADAAAVLPTIASLPPAVPYANTAAPVQPATSAEATDSASLDMLISAQSPLAALEQAQQLEQALTAGVSCSP